MSGSKGFRQPVALRSAHQMTAVCLLSKILIVLLLSLPGVMGLVTLSASAAGAAILTVCPAGPPQCDYAAIQPALDAAVAGDTVLVKPGTYTGQLTLKSQVALESSDGPAVTIITATQGPVVAASGVVSATLHGVSISGRAIVTETLGIDLLDSDLKLSNCIVSGLHGKDGDTAAPNGETAVAIRSEGQSNLVIADSTIQDLRGGNGLAGNMGGAQGGDAIAVTATGTARVTLVSTLIRGLSGGSAGSFVTGPYDCAGSGGSAIAVQTDGDVQLTVSNSQVNNLRGGAPCSALAAGCVQRAGATVGIRAAGGVLHVRNSQFSDFLAQPAPNSKMSHAIHTTHTSETWLERNTVTSLSASGGYASLQARNAGPDSPFCGPPPGNVIAIMSDSDARFVAVENALDKLAGSGWGQAVGVLARHVPDVRLSRNQVSHVSGGFAGLTATGFRLDHVNFLQLNANGLREIHGGDAPGQFYYLYRGSDGGSAAGIELNVVTAATITNNAIWSVTGGHATDCQVCTGLSGGDATALLVSGSSAGIWNNSACRTVAGRGGTVDGQPGKAVGLSLTGAGDVIAVNNALVKHGTGILSDQPNPPVLLRNDLWENDQDYAGVTPGATDLHVAPGFVNPETGDLHLSPASPLIDAGTNSGIPPDAIDGRVRPLDGNNDGLAFADIGADEYWPRLHASKTVDKAIAGAGDVLTYQVTVTNPSVLMIPSISMTDTLPAHTTYVNGSLSGSSGSWGYADGMIAWTCALPPGASATLTFKAKVGDVSGPLAIVNRAVVDDRVGAPQVIEAVTLVNPLRTYLPAIENAH